MNFLGHIDFYGWSADATGWFIVGWSSPWPMDGRDGRLVARFTRGTLSNKHTAAPYVRTDLGSEKEGFLLFLPDPSPDNQGELASLQIRVDAELANIPNSTPAPLEGSALRSQLAELISAISEPSFQAAHPFFCIRRSHEIEIIDASNLIDEVFYRTESKINTVVDVSEHFYDVGHDLGFKPNFYFDPKWYWTIYPDVGARGVNSLYHYIRWGEREGRRPSVLFDPNFYRQKYDIADSECALSHYLLHRTDGIYSPISEFDVASYLEQAPEVVNKISDPFHHYVSHGSKTRKIGALRQSPFLSSLLEHQHEARPAVLPASGQRRHRGRHKQHPVRRDTIADDPTFWFVPPGAQLEPARATAFTELVLSSPFIDDSLCQANLGTSKDDGYTAERYLQHPTSTRPQISYYFDQTYYLARYPDIALVDGIDPLVHYLLTGCREGRSAHPLVDVDHMRNTSPTLFSKHSTTSEIYDALQNDLVDPSPYFLIDEYQRQLQEFETGTLGGLGCLAHYLTVGYLLGLRPNLLFDPGWYYRQLDGIHDFWSGLRHFVLTGDKEGRAPSAEFNSARYLELNPDVGAENQAPFLHYLAHGRPEGRRYAAVSNTGARDHVEDLRIDPFHAIASYRCRVEAATRQQQERKENVFVAPLEILRFNDPAEALKKLAFRHHPKPKISILVAVYNEFRYTIECLSSILQSNPQVSYEVIVTDDASTDKDIRLLKNLKNVKYVRNHYNLGFLENCNRSFEYCRGEYILLLNNDAQLMPGALDALVYTLESDPQIAAAGPKILYPDGRLQEAGCVLDRDGVSTMVGLFDDPRAAGYGYDRDVHYSSGAALLIRRCEVNDTLFDSVFKPAYCEDADLCLGLLSQGRRIVYCHRAEVVHHLSVSIDKGSVVQRLQRVIRNQQKLAEKWSSLLEDLNSARVIAFYLPQYHTTPENDFHWGQGFTEWRNVAKAEPAYVGHYQPHVPADLGFYDLRVKQTIQRQVALARRYGVAGFCVYYYNFGDRRTLDQAFEAVVADQSIEFPYCVCWANENWTRRWDGGNTELIFEQRYDGAALAAIIGDATRYAADPRYLRVNGKPLFLVYRPLLIPDVCGFTDMLRDAFRQAGFSGVHLVYVESMETAEKEVPPAALGFDASVEFPPHGHAIPVPMEASVIREGFVGTQYDYAATCINDLNRALPGYKRYPAVFPSWDNTPRQPLRGDSFVGTTPEGFQAYVEEKLERLRKFFVGDERLLFVNAWNEWAEGTHLEPDLKYGHRWLEAIRNALLTKSLL